MLTLAALARFFTNADTGRVVVVQPPNLPLAVFLVATVVRWLAHPAGTAGTVVTAVGRGALLVWAARLAWRAWGPGRVRGMATRAQAQAMLGPSRLRRVAPVVRPDRYGNRRHR